MCEPTTTIAAVGLGAQLLGIGGKGGAMGPTSLPAVSDALKTPASQAAKTPDQAQARQGTGGAVPRGMIGALLSGAGGVPNSALSLGKAQLLGQ